MIDADVSQSEDNFNVAQGALLREARTRRGLTLRDVETTTRGEFKMASLSVYERGDRGVPMLRLLKLASLYDMQLEELVPKQPMYRTASTIERESPLGGQEPLDPTPYLQAIINHRDEAVIATSPDGRIAVWNAQAEVLYGATAADVLGLHWMELCSAEGGQRSLLKEILSGLDRGESMMLRGRLQRTAEGSLVSIDVQIDPLRNSAGTAIGAAAVASSGAPRDQVRQGFRAGDQFLDWLEEIGRIGTWQNSVGPEALLQLSPQAYRLLGIEPGQAIRNIDFFDLVHPDDRQLLVETFISARNDRKRKQLEVRVLRGDDPIRWLSLAVDPRFDAEGVAVGLLGVAQDITDRKEITASLISDATRDRTTGLPNRYVLLDRLGQALRRANLHGVKVALLLVDLDCSASLGYDALLVTAADRIVATGAVTDTVARVEVNQLMVLCEEVDGLSEARARAERVLGVLREPYVSSGNEVFVNASIGVATSQADATAESMVRDAEVAMARAKHSGGNSCEVYGLSPRRVAE